MRGDSRHEDKHSSSNFSHVLDNAIFIAKLEWNLLRIWQTLNIFIRKSTKPVEQRLELCKSYNVNVALDEIFL